MAIHTTAGLAIDELESWRAVALVANRQVAADVRAASVIEQAFVHIWNKMWIAALHTWNINVAHSQETHGCNMLTFARINNPEGFHMMNVPKVELCPWIRFENMKCATLYWLHAGQMCHDTQCFIGLMNDVLSPCQLVVDYNISCAWSIWKENCKNSCPLSTNCVFVHGIL